MKGKLGFEWDELDGTYNWMAVNESGEVWVFKNKPVIGGNGWSGNGVGFYAIIHQYPGKCSNWKTSLEQRPLESLPPEMVAKINARLKLGDGSAEGGWQGAWTEEQKAAYDKTLEDPAVKLLEDAKRIVTGARRNAYGNPEDNFACIAKLWQAYLDRTKTASESGIYGITPEDVAVMMILMKCARLAETPGHLDSTLDCAGYAACLARCQAVNKP